MRMSKKEQQMKAIIVSLLIGAVFLTGCASSASRKDYKMRASNFDGKKFHNENDFQMLVKVSKGAETGVLSQKGTKPKDKIPLAIPDFLPDSSEDSFFTWFGHSSLLIHLKGKTILFDPVLSNRTSPVSFTGPKRFSALPCGPEDFPEIDILIISHDHYDHLDKSTIKKLDSKVKKYVVPLGVERRLIKFGVRKEKITNMAWWEEISLEGFTIACLPSRHFSGRMLVDNFTTLWASWAIISDGLKIFECADSGWDTHFERIHEKYGDFNLAFMECGQYDLRWPSVHMTPEQSFDAAKTLGTKTALPIHWGAFVLANHPWDDSVSRFVNRSEKQGGDIKVITPLIGETVPLSKITDYQKRWYENIE